MREILDIAATLCIGWMIGTEFTVSVFIGPILEKLGAAKAKATSLFAQRLGAAMPFWYALSLLFLLAETALRRHEPGFGLLVLASAIWATVIVLTIFLLVPINNRIAKLESESFPEKLQQEHRRWEMLHHGRVVALAVAMVCFCIAIRS
ncbi:MAG TPA: DUF1772 domain-containing protein [Edaphobacter sp.]|jgi:uncharacterized membrane protein